MWMMMDSNTNNDHHGRDQLKPPLDLMIGRKLRPLMPRPITSTTTNHPYSTLSTPSCCCTRNPKTLSWNHPMAAAPPLVSTRWNPTPEQLQALEEMYRRGIRTPSAEQIQQIAAKLGRFGKIEGKNVFYWFQNHKARERQKKRRQLELFAGKKMHHAHTSPTKLTGLSRRYYENEKVPITSNCSTPSEDSASMHGAVIAADQCGKDGWPQLHHKELHATTTAENETCWQLDLSSCLPPPPPNNNSSLNAITAHNATLGQENSYPYASLNLITALPNHNADENANANANELINQTLQLFPPSARGEDAPHSFSIRTKITPSEFIEFLPIKN